MTDLTLSVNPNIPKEVERRIRQQERQRKREDQAAVRMRATWRKRQEEALVAILKQSLKELWDTTDLEARILSGHQVTVGIHTVDAARMQELDEKTQEAIRESQRPQLLDPQGNPV